MKIQIVMKMNKTYKLILMKKAIKNKVKMKKINE